MGRINKSSNKKKINISKIIPIIIFIMTIFMGIGYASINSIIIGFEGEAIAKEIDGVFITNAVVDYASTGVADNSKITQAYQTNFGSTVTLSSTYRYAYIDYAITIYNSTDDDYQYVGPEYVEGEATYDNPDIVFKVSGITENYVLSSKQSVTFIVKFMYKDSTIANNNVLNSIINFKFESLAEDDEEDEEEILVSAGVLDSNSTDGNVFGGNLYKYNIESISFVNHENVPTGATSWDASAEKNGTITGWYIDSDSNGSYELYLGADSGRVTLPANCYKLFYYYTALKSIDFSNIDTSQVTNMSEMFHYSYNLTELDLSKFDMSNVTNTTSMFYLDFKLQVIRFDNVSFDAVTSYSYMFYQVPGVIVVKDETAKNWVLTKPLAQNYYGTTVKTVEEYEQGS